MICCLRIYAGEPVTCLPVNSPSDENKTMGTQQTQLAELLFGNLIKTNDETNDDNNLMC